MKINIIVIVSLIIAALLSTPLVSAALFTDQIFRWYTFDETNNSEIIIDHVFGQNANYTGNDGTVGQAGIINNSYSFNGINITGANNLLPDLGTFVFRDKVFSFAAWFNASSSQSFTATLGNVVVGVSDTNANGGYAYAVVNTTGELIIEYQNDTGARFDIGSGVIVNDSQWHHVAFAADGDNYTFYHNGAQVGVVTGLDGNFSNVDQLNIGMSDRTSTNMFFNGTIDELGLWNRTITTDEVSALFNNGNGLQYPNFFLENSHTFVSEVLEGTVATLEYNFSIDSSSTDSVSATLHYNNTLFAVPVTLDGDNGIINTTVNTPIVDVDTNVTFFYEFLLSGGGNSFNANSSFQNQTVQNLGIDDCSVHTNVLLNLTVVDEGTQTPFTSGSDDNVTVEVDLTLGAQGQSTFNQTFTETNPVAVCINNNLAGQSLRLDSQIRYEAFDHVSEFYNLQNFTVSGTNIPQNITLFDLAIIDSQEFLVTFKDVNFIPVTDALIQITRKYIGEGVFKTVEIPKTDSSGQTIGHFVLSDVIYTIIVSKEGSVLATFADVIAVCQDTSTGECTINLNAFQSGTQPSDFTQLNNLTFTLTYDTTTRVFNSIFTTTDGSTATVLLNVTEFADTINPICENELTSASGSVSCTVPATFANTTIRGQLFKDGAFVSELFVQLEDNTPADNFGSTGIMLLLIAYITLPLMLITERIGVVIFAILGFIMAGMLGIFSGGSVVGLGSTVLWFIVAGAIIIYKITRVRQ